MAQIAHRVGGRQVMSPCRSRRGSARPSARRVRSTLPADRFSRKVAKTSAMRACTSRSGLLTTVPVGSRARPAGSRRASSPRRALLSRPAVSRARKVCSSISEIVPLRPSRSLPFWVPGSYDAVAVRDQALAVAAQVEQRVPVRAVAGQPGHVGREDQADLAERDAGDQVLEAGPLLAPGAAPAEVAVDDLDVGLTPAELAGALPQRVLQPEALPVGEDLVRAGLAAVEHRPADGGACCDAIVAYWSPPAAPPRGRGPRRGARWRGGVARRGGARQAFSLDLPKAGGEILDGLGGQLGPGDRGTRLEARRRAGDHQQRALGVGHEDVPARSWRARHRD